MSHWKRRGNLMKFEFLIPKRPLSLQAKARRLNAWKAFVHEKAASAWKYSSVQTGDVQVTLVYLCGEPPPDTDNIVKPILDAMKGLVFVDDATVSDVLSHRRPLTGNFDLTRLPPLLLQGIVTGDECVYVQVRSSQPLEEYL